MRRKVDSEPTPIEALEPDTSRVLTELCMALLRRDPTLRPSGADVLARLGASPASHLTDAETSSLTDVQSVAAHFVGREESLQQLLQALAHVEHGQAVAVHVRGVSGAANPHCSSVSSAKSKARALPRADEVLVSGSSGSIASRCSASTPCGYGAPSAARGDWAGAERAREQAELMALQSRGRQIFEAPLRTEFHAHWLARDLAGVKQAAEQLGRMAASRAGWRVHHRLAEGYFEALRGDSVGALGHFDACVRRCQPDTQDEDRSFDVWLRASAAAIATLLDLDRVGEARERGERVLAECQVLDIQLSAIPIECLLALAEARSGDVKRAMDRIEAAIADQRGRGVSGLLLGACYETRARIAIAVRDEAAAIHYAELVAQECRYGALMSRHGRLLQEARNAGVRMPDRANERPVLTLERAPEAEAVMRALAGSHGSERARRVLQILCERGHALDGHLFCAHSGPNELACVASLGEPEPSAALTRFASGFWQDQLEEAEMSTVLTELPWARQSYEPFTWSDPRGGRHEVLVLYSARVLPLHVGLACLNVGQRVERSTSFLSALASGLNDAYALKP